MGQKNSVPMTAVCLVLLIPSLSFWDPQGVLNKDKLIAETVLALIPQAELGGDSEDMSGHRAIYTMPMLACVTGAHSRELWRVPGASLPQIIDSYLAWKAKLGFLSWLEACPGFAHLRHLALPEGNPTPLGEMV